MKRGPRVFGQIPTNNSTLAEIHVVQLFFKSHKFRRNSLIPEIISDLKDNFSNYTTEGDWEENILKFQQKIVYTPYLGVSIFMRIAHQNFL